MIEPKYKVGQTLFAIQEGEFIEGDVNEITITITKYGESFNYLFVKMIGGGKAYYAHRLDESKVFESKEEIIQYLKTNL